MRFIHCNLRANFEKVGSKLGVAVMTNSNSDQFRVHRFVVNEPSFQNVHSKDFYVKRKERYSHEKVKNYDMSR